jgi:hypothetical protein
MLPVSLLIALTILTWAAAIYSLYAQPEDMSGHSAADEPHGQDYYDAA